MYVAYAHICIHVCMLHTRIYVYMYVCCIRAYKYTCMYVAYAHICIHVYMLRTPIYLYICIYVVYRVQYIRVLFIVYCPKYIRPCRVTRLYVFCIVTWEADFWEILSAGYAAPWFATDCNTLQHTATHCNTLQHTATHCNTQLVMPRCLQCPPLAFLPPPTTIFLVRWREGIPVRT